MREALAGAIDCDVHPSVPGIGALLPYLDDYWRDIVEVRGMEGFESRAYPPLAPESARPDWRRGNIRAAETVEVLREDVLDRWSLDGAVLNCLYGVQQIHDERLSAALCKAVNDWLVEHWLDKDPRLAASIVVPPQNPDLAVEEIERLADDKRFVQVLMPAMHDLPHGRRYWWPIYRAALRHGLPIGLHIGSAYRQPVTAVGWPSYYIEEMTGHAAACQAGVASLAMQGVFERFPKLKMIMIEGGFAWLASLGWRLDKHWADHRDEVPQVVRPPSEVLKEHLWISTQPMEEPERASQPLDVMSWIGFDRLLIATDYPHWDFDDPAFALPRSLTPEQRQAIASGNAKNVYRLQAPPDG